LFIDTTVYEHIHVDDQGFPDTFIITGDIPAMWIRDSTNQVRGNVVFVIAE
jgi:meiotically up-regulated gene 157 (Mug157) protein